MGDKRKVGFEKKIQFSNTELAMLRSFQPKTLKDPESIGLILKNCEIRIGKFLNFPSELLSYLLPKNATKTLARGMYYFPFGNVVHNGAISIT